MVSYFEIDVTHNGRHFFATAARSGETSEEGARLIFDTIKKRFTEDEGYSVTCIRWVAGGHVMNF